MDRNTRILAAVFGALIVYVLYSSVAHPLWIEPLFTIDDTIAERSKELDKLEETEAAVHQAKLEYRDILDRIGSFDELTVQNDLRERLNELVARYKLESVGTSPSRPQADRKTKVTTMHVTVTAVGTLESAIGFLRDASELPHLLRIGNASIYPVGSSRKSKRQKQERVNIRVPLEVKVLPQQRLLGGRVHDEDLEQPEALVRHEDRDYSPIWTGTPFTPFIPLKPLVVDAGTDVDVQVGRRTFLNGKITGGDGQYACRWSPGEGLSDPASPTPKVDTAEPFTQTYTLTVNDGSENREQDSVTVTVTEKTEPEDEPEVAEAEPEAAPRADRRWKDRKNMQLCMTLMRSEGDSRLQEVMIYDRKSKETKYYPVQAEFDGGTLVRVHPRGGIVRRDDGEAPVYFVYPVGAKLNEDIRAEDAGDYPVLQSLAFGVRDAELAALEAEEPDGDEEPDADAGPPDGAESEPGDSTELTPGKPAAGKDSAAGAKSDAADKKEPATAGAGEKAGVVKPVSAKPGKQATGKKPGSKERKDRTSGTKPASPKPGVDADDGKGVKGEPKAKAKKGKSKSQKAGQKRPSAKKKRRSSKTKKERMLQKRSRGAKRP
ncbi:MAG: hypothetical protein ACYTFA_14335 [Planctomycetota bacterium]|jgi:hypothetical protein